MEVPTEMIKVVGLLLGAIVVFVLSQYIFPNDLAETVIFVLAAP